MPLQLDYYYGNEAEQYSFYRIPKILFTDPLFKGISVEAKVLYGLLLDRMGLSVKNNWLDGEGACVYHFHDCRCDGDAWMRGAEGKQAPE